MKCIAIVVMLAIACANASIIPYPYGVPYPYAAYAHPHVVPAITQFSHVDYAAVPAAVHVAAYAPHAHWPYHVHAPVSVVVAAPAVALAKAPATYTAQTRGSLHTAPLEGHEVSQTSLNLEPAPGSE